MTATARFFKKHDILRRICLFFISFPYAFFQGFPWNNHFDILNLRSYKWGFQDFWLYLSSIAGQSFWPGAGWFVKDEFRFYDGTKIKYKVGNGPRKWFYKKPRKPWRRII